jgi:hypothetical protein
MTTIRLTLLALAAAAILAAAASGSAPPVGPLPAGPVQRITTERGELVAIALPHAANGRSWRLARPVNPKVLREVSEADVGANVVVVYRSFARGSVTVSYALTRGETRHAYAARRFTVLVR